MWFIHEWMKALNIKYYIGNLSAAAIYGEAHQAVQSTPSATAIDLVRYMNRLGGPSAVATVLTELAEQIETEEFAKTIIQMNAEITVLQRLGVIFEIIGQKSLTNVI